MKRDKGKTNEYNSYILNTYDFVLVVVKFLVNRSRVVTTTLR